MNSKNCPSQMIFILLLLLTDPIALKEVKNSTFFFFFGNVPLLEIAIAVTGILFNCKKKKKLSPYFMTIKSSSSIFNTNYLLSYFVYLHILCV